MSHARTNARPGRWGGALWVGAFMAVAMAIRCYRIGSEGVWWDEYHVFGHFRNNDWWLAFRAWRFWGSDNAPLHTLLAYAWYALIDQSVTANRVFSVFCSLLSFPLLYGFTLRFFGRSPALFACALLALSPHHAWYAQAIRPYALMEPFALASWWGMLEHLRRPARWKWLAHVIANILLLWTHPLAVFMFALQFLFLAGQWRKWQPLLVWCLPHGIATGALLMYFLPVREFILEASVDHLALPDARKFFVDLLADDAIRLSNEFWFPLVQNPGLWMARVPRLEGLLNTAVFVISIATVPITLARLRNRASRSPVAIWLLLVYLAPSVIMLVVSLLWRPLFEPRYVYYCSVALYPLAAGALASVRFPTLRVIAGAAVIAVMVGQLALLMSGVTRPPWPQAAERIVSLEQPGDAVFVKFAGPCNDEIMALTLNRPNEAVRPGYSPRSLCREVKHFLREHPAAAAWVVMQDEESSFTSPGGLTPYFPSPSYQLEEWRYSSAFSAGVYRITSRGAVPSDDPLPAIPAEPLAPLLGANASQEELADFTDFPIAPSKLYYYVLATAMYDLGHVETGMRAAEASLQINSEYPPAKLLRAVGLAFDGRDAEAWQVFEEGAAKDRTWLPIFEPFMKSLLQEGNVAKAAEEYDAIRYVGMPCRALYALLKQRQAENLSQ